MDKSRIYDRTGTPYGLCAHNRSRPGRLRRITPLDAHLAAYPDGRTHWCRLCRSLVEPMWMLVRNATELVAHHRMGDALHAVTAATRITAPVLPDRAVIIKTDGRFVTIEP